MDATPLNNNPQLDYARGTRDDDREVVIEPQNNGQIGYGDRDGNGQGGRYQADGTSYTLDQEATIQSGENVEITFVAIRQPNGDRINFNLEPRVDASTADVTVRLQYRNRPDQLFYFEDVS